MSYKYGTTLTCNVRFQSSFSTNTRVYFPQDADLNYDALEWDQYETTDIPAAGSSMTDSGALLHGDGPQYLGQFVAPVDCRLVGLAYAIYLTNPESGATNVRLGAMKAVFSDEDAAGSDGSWTSLGYIDSTTMSGDPAAEVQKGSTSFNSSNGDVSAGEVVGIVGEGFGGTVSQNINTIEGIITMIFRAQ